MILIPAAALLAALYYFLHESPRFLLCKSRLEETFSLIDEMGKINSNEYVNLTENDKAGLEQWGK